MTHDRTGGCLCGKVRFRVKDCGDALHICHCSMCRKWSGGPGFSLEAKNQVIFESDDTLSWYDSSDWAERGFCNQCGTGLFYRLRATPDDLMVSAGSLDDQTGLHVESQIFIDEKPAHYDFAGDIPAMTGEEVFAMFADPESGGGDKT